MPKRPAHARQTTDAPPESRYRVTHYGESRYFAVYEGADLLAVTVYRKGAAAITARLDAQERAIAALRDQLAALPATPSPPPPSPDAPVSPPAWQPPEQLALLAAEAIPATRIVSPRRQPSPAPRCA